MLEKKQQEILTSFSPRRFCDPWSFDMTGHFGPPLDKLKSAAFSSFLDEVSKSPRDEKSPNESSSSTEKRSLMIAFPFGRFLRFWPAPWFFPKAIATSSEAGGHVSGYGKMKEQQQFFGPRQTKQKNPWKSNIKST